MGYFDTERTDKIILSKSYLALYYRSFINSLDNLRNKHLSFIFIDITYCLDKYFRTEIKNDNKIFKEYLMQITNINRNNYIQSSRLIKILKNIKNSYTKDVEEIIVTNWITLMLLLIKNAYDSEDLTSLEELHILYSQNLSSTIEIEHVKDEIQSKIYSLFSSYTKDYETIVTDEEIMSRYHDTDESYTRNYIEDKYWDSYSQFFSDCGLSDYYDDFEHELDINTEDVLNDIIKNYSYDDDNYRTTRIIEKEHSSIDELRMIEDLFNR